MPRVLITCMHLARHFEALRPQYEELGVEVFIPPLEGQQFSASQMAEHIVGCDTVIAGDDIIDAHVLDVAKAEGVKAIIKWGIGTDGIDKLYATKIAIPVYNTPGVFGEEVADLALSHLLMLARKTHQMDRSVKEGGWFKSEGMSLAGKTAGVIGLGSIGQAIARRCAAFGMDVIGYDVAEIDTDTLASMATRQVSIEELTETADVLLLACALTDESRHLVSAEMLSRVKPGSVIINVSRGPLIDETALAKALADGRIAGAGLDVFEEEPLPAISPLRDHADKCTFSTHNGSNTREAVDRINQMTSDIAFDVLGLKAAPFDKNHVA